jgi:ElaB/YqjD/DUF883 family membrane-anchored ribosome-binding protein
MKYESSVAGNIAETTAEEERSMSSSGSGNLKNVVADTLHDVAQTISRKVASTENQEVARYGMQASAMLEQSADYVRELDYGKVEASVREYIKEKPGRSLLIAGVTGLVLGAILRRR